MFQISLNNSVVEVWENADVRSFFAKRKRNTNKGDYGVVNIVAGDERYLGASVLASRTALRSGCGYVKLTCDDGLKNLMLVKYPQVIYLNRIDKRANCIAIGMGGGVSKKLYSKICNLLNNYNGTLLVDADGINCFAKYGVDKLRSAKGNVILTPHVKEFSRLTGVGVEDIINSPVSYAKNFAKKYSVTLILKDAKSVITDGERVVVNERGTTALAKAGSGDMLSGFIAGTCARGVAPFEACVCGAYVMGVSAELSSQEKTDYCATANDIIKILPHALKNIIDNSPIKTM